MCQLQLEQDRKEDEVGISKGVAIVPQTDVLREDQGIHIRPAVLNIDIRAQNNVLEPEEEIVDIIPPMPVGSARSSPHTEDVMTSTPQGSSTNDDRPQMIPVKISHNRRYVQYLPCG